MRRGACVKISQPFILQTRLLVCVIYAIEFCEPESTSSAILGLIETKLKWTFVMKVDLIACDGQTKRLLSSITAIVTAMWLIDYSYNLVKDTLFSGSQWIPFVIEHLYSAMLWRLAGYLSNIKTTLLKLSLMFASCVHCLCLLLHMSTHHTFSHSHCMMSVYDQQCVLLAHVAQLTGFVDTLQCLTRASATSIIFLQIVRIEWAQDYPERLCF